MTQAQLDRAVAAATGESLPTIRRLGFGPSHPHDRSPRTWAWSSTARSAAGRARTRAGARRRAGAGRVPRLRRLLRLRRARGLRRRARRGDERAARDRSTDPPRCRLPRPARTS